MDKEFTYKKILPGNTIMVVVPHEDDEINTAGATIYDAKKEGFRVICVFLTNGDWEYPADIRFKEAIDALGVLGVPEKDIIFLGYPDGGVHAERSVFQYGKSEKINALGRDETYGTQSHPDYAIKYYGHHQVYTFNNFLMDLENVILDYQPDTLIVTDFDSHPDHRMCSLAFETVMGRILNTCGNTYHPLVLKGFAYADGFESIKDFPGKHVISTRINKKKLSYPEYDTDNPVYEWTQRVRFPVSSECKTMDLSQNKIFQALTCHMSQKANRRARSIINGDQIFWARRTDNLIYEGNIEVSSGESKYLHDFRMMGTEDISAKRPTMADYLWIPEAGDIRKTCRCTFKEPKKIQEIILYGNIEEDSRIEEGEIIFSTGYRCLTGALRRGGKANYISIPEPMIVDWIEFRIVSSYGSHAGISEWEIFSSTKGPLQLLQITVDDNLSDNWIIWPGEVPQMGIYLYGIENSINWYIDGEKCTMGDISQKVQNLSKKISVRAEYILDPAVANEMCFSPATFSYRVKWLWKLIRSRWQFWLENQKEKRPHHRLKAIKRKGIREW